MYFGSDNIVGASQPVLDAIVKANSGVEASYGADSGKKRVDQLFCDLFEREVQVFLVATGTAANALCVAATTPPWSMCISNVESHINDEECGAPEFYSHGAKLLSLPGEGGKLSPKIVEDYVAALPIASFQMPAKSISLSQLNECGQSYKLTEIKAICDVAKKYNLYAHMDGARFANALVNLNCSPAEMTWKQGIDILSFGATKNGALAAEAIVVFNPELAETMEYRRKRAGQTLSKGRFLSSQMEGYLINDHWLDNARHANKMALLLKEGLEAIPGVRIPWALGGNEIFPILPLSVYNALKQSGAVFYDWSPRSVAPSEKPSDQECMVRLVASFTSKQESIERFLKIARST